MEEFTATVIKVIKSIPKGRVSTYGKIARMAGKTRGARQVARILHSMSRKHDLPWHRVVNAKGCISLPKFGGYEEQKAHLKLEGIEFDENDRLDLEKHLWPGDCQKIF